MKLRNQFLTLAAALVVGGSFLAGCTTDNTVTPPTDNRTKVISSSNATKMVIGGFVEGHLYAFSVTGMSNITKIAATNSTAPDSITVFWTRDPLDNGADTVNYIEVTSPTTSDPVSGATAITWATAAVAKGLTVYETGDATAGHGSGLVLAGAASKVVSIVGTDSSNVDLVLATDNDMGGLPYLALVSPSVTKYSLIWNGRKTFLGDNASLVGGGSANDRFSASIVNGFSQKVNLQELYDGNYKDSALIVYVQTADATPHYAAVEIVPQPDGSGGTLMWKDVTTPTGKRRAIVVNVYYQNTAGWGYVGRPGIVRRGSNEAPVRGGALIRR